MKLLLFSDLHADTNAAYRLVQLAAEADVLVGAGDFGNMRRNVSRCIEILSSIDRPAILVPGNNESTEELTSACDNWASATILHGNSTTIDGVTFFGLGGGVPPTPFGDWSFDFTESAATALLKNCPAEAVLVSHSPPMGVLDLASSGAHLGSRSVLEAIQTRKPRLVVCGHVHACAGKRAKIGSTSVINAGPEGILWDLA